MMDEAFEIDDDFLTGSYARWTKTKPLKDVDIFCVSGERSTATIESQAPSVLLADGRTRSREEVREARTSLGSADHARWTSASKL